MTDICCPICGCKKIQVFPQSTTPHFKNRTSAFAKPSIQNLMPHVVSYAAMVVSSARLIKGQRPAIDLVGALIGGAVGCAVCFLNYAQGQVFESIGRDMPKINPYIYVWNVNINLPDL